MKDDVINVYWSPFYMRGSSELDWTMLYPDPKTLFNSLNEKRNIEAKNDSFLICPASKNLFKQTYVYKNVIKNEYEYDFSKNNEIIKPLTNTSLLAQSNRISNIEDGPLISINLSYIFFADSSLNANFTQPFFSNSEYTKYGSVVPGRFDIGRWFRPFNIEIQMWHSSGILKINQDEDLFYINFDTDKKIKMHRFNMNEQTYLYATHCVMYKNIFGPLKPLNERYSRFKDSKMNNAILKEINKTLVGENND